MFGWQMQQFDPSNVMVTTTDSDENGMPKTPGAINGSLYSSTEITTSNPVIDVPNMNEMISKLKEMGHEIVTEPTEVPNMGRYARFKDPAGNIIGLWQSTVPAAQ